MSFFFFQAEDGIRDAQESRGLGDVYKRQVTNISFSDATATTSNCTVTQVRTFTAVDGCGNSATASRTVTWTSDLTPPVITITQTPLPPGCNPTTADINAALGSATATDACGIPTVSSSDGAVSSNGCLRTQVRTFTATDACGN